MNHEPRFSFCGNSSLTATNSEVPSSFNLIRSLDRCQQIAITTVARFRWIPQRSLCKLWPEFCRIALLPSRPITLSTGFIILLLAKSLQKYKRKEYQNSLKGCQKRVPKYCHSPLSAYWNSTRPIKCLVAVGAPSRAVLAQKPSTSVTS